jgi:hypothetical protein
MSKAIAARILRFLWQQKAAFHVVMGGGLCAFWGWGLMYFTPAFLHAYLFSMSASRRVYRQHPSDRRLDCDGRTAWLLSRPSMADPRRVVWLLAAGIALATIPSIIAYWTHSLSCSQS